MRGSTAGFHETIVIEPRNAHAILLEVIDILISSFVVAPLVVGYWRGTWNLMNMILYPNDAFSSAVASLGIGIVGHLIFTIFKDQFANWFHPDKKRLTFFFVSRIYTALFGIVCVNGWRGLWSLIDQYSEYEFYPIFLTSAFCIVVLALMRGVRNITASPFFLATDHSKEYFSIPTMFKTSGSNEPALYILDCLFSVIVIGSLVVFVWRGIWVLVDLTLYTDDKDLSAFGSLAIGYGIVGTTFAIQPVMRWACDRIDGPWRVVIAEVFLFFSFLGTINIWRGVWYALDVFFLPENPLLSDAITHILSLVLLSLLNCSNSVLVRGVYIDAEEPAGQCVVFPVYYVRLFFQKERIKKKQRLIESLERAEQNNLLLEKRSSHHSILLEKRPSIIINSSHVKKEKSDTIKH